MLLVQCNIADLARFVLDVAVNCIVALYHDVQGSMGRHERLGPRSRTKNSERLS